GTTASPIAADRTPRIRARRGSRAAGARVPGEARTASGGAGLAAYTDPAPRATVASLPALAAEAEETIDARSDDGDAAPGVRHPAPCRPPLRRNRDRVATGRRRPAPLHLCGLRAA